MNTTEELQKELFVLLKKIGRFTLEPKKESIHIVHGRAFVGIHPKKSYLGLISFLTKARLLPGLTK